MARPRLHDDALRTRLLEVASEVISTGGPAALTVRATAQRAGTSPSAVYALFGSRDHLLTAVGEEGFRRFGAHLDAVERYGDPRAHLLALGLAYRSSALADPHFYRVMFDVAATVNGTPDPDETMARPTFQVLRDAVARLLDAGPGPERTPAAVAPTTAATSEIALRLWGLVHGMVALELAGLLPGDDASRAQRYESTLRALGAELAAAEI